MTVLVHWLMLVLFVGWGAFFIFVLFRFRKRREPEGELRRRQRQVREVHRGRRRRRSKSSCWSFYAIPAWAKRVKAFPSESEAVVVRVVGEQFAWNMHYPGPDGKFGRTDIKLVTRRQSARPRSHAIRTPRTTSRRSTS